MKAAGGDKLRKTKLFKLSFPNQLQFTIINCKQNTANANLVENTSS